MKDSARAAYKRGQGYRQRQLDELGITREKGEDTIRSLFRGVGDAARASANAALDAARKG